MFSLFGKKSSVWLGVFSISLAICGQAEILVNPKVEQNYTGKDDLSQLQHLTLATGWEFSPNSETTAKLKQMKIARIRCINVANLPGKFDKDGNYQIDRTNPSRLDAHLQTCTELRAIPHIILEGMPEPLQIKAQVKDDGISLMGGGKRIVVCGPSDYRLYRNYWIAYFEYVILTKGFKNAVFEVFNEPDIGGVVCPTAVTPERGSAELYNIMFNLYTQVVMAAEEFEKKHPGTRIKIGGPALAWAYTFRFGSFNWGERFIRDCAEKKIRADFVGVHVYGNISSLSGEYKAGFPSFLEMLSSLKKTRDQYLPGLPVYITEWGPSYVTDNSEKSMVNADNIGAAWSMEFLKTSLENGVDTAIYLVTTDLLQPDKNGKLEDIWGWPSLMVNPQVFGAAYTKPIGHLFTMIAALKGKRVESTRCDNINSFAVADTTSKKIQVIAWNYASRIPEGEPAIDFSTRENVGICIRNAEQFFGSSKVKVSRRLISETNANALFWYRKGKNLTADNTALKSIDQGTFTIINDQLSCGMEMPPSSVALIEFEPDKQ